MQQQGLQRSALTALETEMEAAAVRAAHEAAEAQARVAALQAESEVAVRRAEAAEAQLVELRQTAEAQAKGRMVAGAGADTRVRGIAAAENGLEGTRMRKQGHRRSSTDEGGVVAALRQLRREEDTSSPLGGRSRRSPAMSRDMSPSSSRDRLDDLARGVVHAQRDAAGEFELGAAELLRSPPDRHGAVETAAVAEATAAAEARATDAEAALSAARAEQAAVRAEAAEAVAAAEAEAAAANERAESAEVPALPAS